MSQNRGVLTGKPSPSNINGIDQPQQQQQPSPGATILDTLKKKMNQLKEELESSKEDAERYRSQFEEEKRRREVVSLHLLLLKTFICSLF